LIGGNIPELRLLSELRNHPFCPCVEFRLIGIFQRVLKLVAAGAVIDCQVLYGLQVEMYAIHLLQFGLEPVDYRCSVDVALSE
jgi:hypothetical protein